MKKSVDKFSIKRHMDALKCTGETEYFSWCKKNGFAPTLEKTNDQIKREREFGNEQLAKQAFTRDNKALSLKKALLQLKTSTSKIEGYPYADYVNEALKKNRDSLLDAFIYLEEHSDLFEQRGRTYGYMRTVADLVDYKIFWIRPLNEWVPKSHNADRQISSLIRHLLAKYEVPLFMDEAWVPKSTYANPGSANYYYTATVALHKEWYIHVASGNNIRTAPSLPFPLTKKMAHHFLEAPDDYKIGEALQYGLIIAEGGDRRLAQSLRGTRFYQIPDTDMAFKSNVVRFFLTNTMIASEKVGPLLDYVYQVKYVRAAPDGRIEQPNFTFTGRTYDSLEKLVERWHRQLGKEKKGDKSKSVWNHSNIHDFEYTEGEEGRQNYKRYIIRELTTKNDLIEEGRSMKHCVSSYAFYCEQGKCTIWSLTLHDSTGNWRLLTIEVRGNAISQIRGPLNRKYTPKEIGIIHRWASKEGLSVSSYA